MAACLGLVLAEHRGDRVIALDANPDAGTLAERLTGESSVTVRDLLRDLDRVASWTDLSRYLSLAGRLQVVASEQDPASGDAFSREEYERVCAVLGPYFDVASPTRGPAWCTPRWRARSHSPTASSSWARRPSTAPAAPAKTLDWLARARPRPGSSAPPWSSCPPTGSARTSTAAGSALLRRPLPGVVDVPFDPHLASGGRIELARLRRPTRRRSTTSPRSSPTGSRPGPRRRPGGGPAGARPEGLPWTREPAPRPGEPLGLQHP